MDTQTATADLNDIDSILGDLDLTSGETDQSIAEIIEAAEELAAEDGNTVTELAIEDLTTDELELRKLDAELERQEAYEEQESELQTAAPVPAADPNATQQTVVPATRAPRAASTPRTPRDMNALSPEIFVLEGAVPSEQADLDAAKAAVMAAVPGQKKVAEKFENLFTSLAAGKHPSTFVTQAFQLLDAKGTIGSSDLVAAFKTPGAKSDTEGYNEGTARSQAGQIMALFDAVKIATRTKQALTLNANSNLAAALRKVLAA